MYILFVVSLLTLIIVAAIAVAAVLVFAATVDSHVIMIAVAALIAVTDNLLRRFAFVRSFRWWIFCLY